MARDKYEEIKTRYENKYITPEQLHKYNELKVITQEEYEHILGIDKQNIQSQIEETNEIPIRRRRRNPVGL